MIQVWVRTRVTSMDVFELVFTVITGKVRLILTSKAC